MTENLFTALAAANAELTNPPANREGQARGGRYRYADLSAITEHVRPVYARHGLSFMQDVAWHREDGVVLLLITTRITHAAGDHIDFGPFPCVFDANPQVMGSALTYAKRYALGAALGVSADVDDDGQEATNANPKGYTVKHSGPLGRDEAKRAGGPCTEGQVQYIAGLMRRQGLNEVALNTLSTAELGFEMPVGGLAHLTFDQASRLIDRMKPDGGQKKATRSKGTPPDDPFYDVPLIDPASGEAAE